MSEFDSGLGRDVTNLGRGLALSMLLAHYLYLASSGLGMMAHCFGNQDRQDHHEGRSTQHHDTTHHDTMGMWLRSHTKRPQIRLRRDATTRSVIAS